MSWAVFEPVTCDLLILRSTTDFLNFYSFFVVFLKTVIKAFNLCKIDYIENNAKITTVILQKYSFSIVLPL